MRKIKIIYLIPQLLTGGTERHLCDLVSNIDAKKFEVVVWVIGKWGPIGDEIESAGIKVFNQPLRFYRPDDFIKAYYFVKKGQFDIFHSYSYSTFFIDAIISKVAGIPVYVSSRRNIRHWKGGEKLHFGERIRNQFSKIVIANSEAVKRKTIEIETVDPDKIKVIHNGVDLDEISKFDHRKSRVKTRKILGVSDNAVVIGNLSNLKPIKGQEYLIHAFEKVLNQTSNKIKCVIIGDGPEKERLEDLAKNLRIDEHVIITSLDNNRFEILSSFDIFVLPSLAEGFPNVILEAMALGKPVISTNVGGIPEEVVIYETGYLVPPKDTKSLAKALIDLISNKDLQIELGRKGRKRVEKYFTLKEMVKKHEKLYETLMNNL